MLQVNSKFFKKFIVIICLNMIVSGAGFAGSSNSTQIKQGWSTKDSNLTWGVSDYLLSGCSDPNSLSANCRGTYSDEGAIVVNMARKFNDRGGLFCPTQIQFGNTNNQQKIWVNLYAPTDAADCKWLCIDGYKGTDCAETDSGEDVGTTSLKLLKKGDVRLSGGSDYRISSTIDIFDKSEHTSASSERGAWIHVLAILKYLDHGVLVGHLWVYGTRDWNGGSISSWVTRAHGETNNGRERILCDKGYKVNSAKTDCELINPNAAPKTMCSGWTEDEYKAHQTEFEYKKVGGCYQYRCADRNKAFPTASSRTCVDCSTGVRGGADNDGVCQKCELGEYFDETDIKCKAATGLSKAELQYGSSKAKSGNINNECWTKTSPYDYCKCVLGNKCPLQPETQQNNNTTSNNQTNSGSASGKKIITSAYLNGALVDAKLVENIRSNWNESMGSLVINFDDGTKEVKSKRMQRKN